MVEKVVKDKVYRIRHSRKGAFYGRALADDDGGEWLDFMIMQGTANAILSCNVKEEGDKVTLRREHCHLSEVPEQQALRGKAKARE